MNQALLERQQVDEENFRELIDLASEAVFLARRNGELLHVNEAACALSGHTRSALLKLPIDRMLALTWPHEEDEGLNPAWQHGRLDPVETWLRRADGSWLAVEARAVLLPGGKVQIWIRDISTRRPQEDKDISERDRLEHTLGANGRLLQTIVDLLPVGVWIADRSGRIIGSNPAATRIWKGAQYAGIPEHGAYKGWWVETGEPIAPQDWAMARAITKGETTSGELVRIQCADGSFKTIIQSAAPLVSDEGDISGAIVVNEDITRLHEP